MKVLLVSTNRHSVYGPVAPLGVATLLAAIKNKHDVHMMDLVYSNNWKLSIREEMLNNTPDVVALSIRNIDNSNYLQYENYVQYYIELVSYIKNNFKTLIIIGGAGFSIAAEQFMQILKPDYGIIGPGESKIIELLDVIQKNNDTESLKNVYYWRNGQVVVDISDDIYDCEFGDVDRRKLPTDFLSYGDMGNIETTRGCIFQCIYCSIPCLTKKIHVKDIKQTIKELNEMKRNGYRAIYFTDNILNYSKEYFQVLCEEIISNNLSDLNYQCQVVPQNMDDSLMQLAIQAGFKCFQLSALSCDDKVLLANKKGFVFKDIENIVENSRKREMKLELFFIFGLVGEDENSISKTIYYINKWNSLGIYCDFSFGTRVFSNTQLYNYLPEEEKCDDICKPVFYITEYVKGHIKEIEDRIENKSVKPNRVLYDILCTKYKTMEQREKYLVEILKRINKENNKNDEYNFRSN